jgi:hypothetical protein
MLQGWMNLLEEVAGEAEAQLGSLGAFTAADLAVLVGTSFLGGEAMILLGDDGWTGRVRTALCRVGDLIRAWESRPEVIRWWPAAVPLRNPSPVVSGSSAGQVSDKSGEQDRQRRVIVLFRPPPGKPQPVRAITFGRSHFLDHCARPVDLGEFEYVRPGVLEVCDEPGHTVGAQQQTTHAVGLDAAGERLRGGVR